MNKLKIKDWVAALRSGDYTQGSYRLFSNEGFCCLGVACQLVNPHAWKLDSQHTIDLGGRVISRINRWGDSASFWPTVANDSLRKSLLLNRSMTIGQHTLSSVPQGEGSIFFSDEDGTEYTIADLNDLFKFDFNQIGRIIEHFFDQEGEVTFYEKI